jgi:serine/threonine protein kinase
MKFFSLYLRRNLFSGTYGDVFRVRHRLTGEIYALKQIRDEHEANGIPATAMREAAILKQLNHKNIIKLQDVFLTNERCYFLLEYMDEDLKRYLDKNRPLDRRIIKVERKNTNYCLLIYSSRILCINYLMQFFIVINIVLFIEI